MQVDLTPELIATIQAALRTAGLQAGGAALAAARALPEFDSLVWQATRATAEPEPLFWVVRYVGLYRCGDRFTKDPRQATVYTSRAAAEADKAWDGEVLTLAQAIERE